MSPSKPELLLFDLDGTLLDVDRTIRPSTREVLTELMRRGVRVGFSTGRSPVSVRRFVDELQPNGPLILFNGCVLWDVERDEAVASRQLDREVAIGLVEATVDLEVHANVYIGRDLFVRHRGPLSLASEEKDGVPHTEVPDIVEHVRSHENAPFKLLCIDDEAAFGPLIERFRAVTTTCTIVNSEPTYLEVLPPGVNKGAMVDEIEALYGIDRSRIAAFGDELNDVELLQCTGTAVLMGNCNPRMRSLVGNAVCIGGNSEDAIAEYLRGIFGL